MIGNKQLMLQTNKYSQCLVHVSNDFGMLLQNAENLAYKLGAIKENEMHYLYYDYYKQYNKKDEWIIRKNILTSMNILSKQFTAIKQETGNPYIFPWNLDSITNDVENWREKVSKISKDDVKYYDAIITIIKKGKFPVIKGWEEVYEKCKQNKENYISANMWINMSPPILNNIDNQVEETLLKNQSNPNFIPEIKRDCQDNYDEKLIRSNEINREEKAINELLKRCKDKEYIKEKIIDFQNNFECDPKIEEKNKKLYNELYSEIEKDKLL